MLPEPMLRLRCADPTPRQLVILDTNIMNYAVTSQRGAVINKLNEQIETAKLVHTPTFGFCMTPFQMLEVLGTAVPEIGVLPKRKKDQTAGEYVGSVVDTALANYIALPELSQKSLEARAHERRSYLPVEGRELFDMCILRPAQLADLAGQIASALAWDWALKVAYPKEFAKEIDSFLVSLLLVSGQSNISRFRVAKRLWDSFYANARTLVSEAADGIAEANKAMRLKSRRDFLDCDLIHLACFGWFDDDVIVLTCDPPDTIRWRISVYKGMVQAAAANAPTVNPARLPAIRAGLIVCCGPDGEISHVFPVQRLPTVA